MTLHTIYEEKNTLYTHRSPGHKFKMVTISIIHLVF